MIMDRNVAIISVLTGGLVVYAGWKWGSSWILSSVSTRGRRMLTDTIADQQVQDTTHHLVQELVNKLIANEELKVKSQGFLSAIVGDKTLQKDTYSFLNTQLTLLTNDEKTMASLINWISEILTNPETSIAVTQFLNNFWEIEENRIMLMGMLENMLQDPQMIKMLSDYLTAVLQEEQLLKTIEDGLTTAASNGLRSEEVHSAGAHGIQQTLAETLLPTRLLNYFKSREKSVIVEEKEQVEPQTDTGSSFMAYESDSEDDLHLIAHDFSETVSEARIPGLEKD